ncbi:MAG: MotE family protein [Thermodesulforhabdaceae bacterium]|jgi:flagellar motility protein MotE (MotC chaperone)
MRSKLFKVAIVLAFITSVLWFLARLGAMFGNEKGFLYLMGGGVEEHLTTPKTGENLNPGSPESKPHSSLIVSEAYAQSNKASKKGSSSTDKKTSSEAEVQSGSRGEKDSGEPKSAEATYSQSILPAECGSLLEKKERELIERERMLAAREALLKDLQKDIEAKLARLEEIQKNIESFKKEQERLKNEKIDSLVKIYGSMKPKEASKLLEKLDDDLVVSIISRMTTDQAAKIIANMDIKKAAEISQKLSREKNVVGP